MGRLPRAAEGGMVYQVLNRANARTRVPDQDSDYTAFEKVLVEAHEPVAMRTCIARGRPYASDSWDVRMARRLGLTRALRARGRPRKEKRPGKRRKGS